MSVRDAYDQATAEHAERQARAREVGRCYRAVFFGAPQPSDQATVREDLEAFCGMRANLMRSSFEDTAHAIGQFRVWQRIIGFCFPRDDTNEEVSHGQAPPPHRPTPGGGIAERTTD